MKVHVEVTQVDIDEARALRSKGGYAYTPSCDCPMSRALSRALGEPTRSYTIRHGGACCYSKSYSRVELPDVADRFIENFDVTGAASTTSFDLELPERAP